GLGLVSEVVLEDELERAGLAIVDDLLASSPLALRMTKACFYANVDASSLEAALELEDRNQILLARGPSFREGVDAFRAKPSPLCAVPRRNGDRLDLLSHAIRRGRSVWRR